MPALPDTHAIFVMALTVVALVLFSRDRIPLETSCLAIFVVLIFTFVIAPYPSRVDPILTGTDFFEFFGHEALIAIGALMILGRALELTGALKPLAILLSSGWKARPKTTLLLTLVLSAAASAFLNNTPIVLIMLPILVAAGLRTKQPVSGMLMPMGLATIIGGMATTIGTSTNLLVVRMAESLGVRPFGMFDFTVPVIVAGSVGIVFLWLIAPKMLPHRVPPMADTSPRIFNAMLRVQEEGFAAGKSLSEVLAKTNNRMAVSKIQRGKGLFGEGLFIARLPSVTLQPGDLLYVNDTPENLKEYESLLQTTLYNVSEMDDEGQRPIDEGHPLTAEGQSLAEVVVTRGSLLHHRTLNAVRFVDRYRLLPLAIHRASSEQIDAEGDIGDVKLRAGDVLLVQGPDENIAELKRGGAMLVLDGTSGLPHTKQATRALIIAALVIIPAAQSWLPISVSAVFGVVMLILTRTITWRNATAALSTPVVMIIVTSLALGLALVSTGAADYLAQVFVATTHALPTPLIASGLMLLMAILTNIVSNAAAAGIGTPIAISVAQQIGAPLEPFVLAVIFGANMSFATPMGYQTNLLVMSAGGYKFSDFLRIGIPLTLILWMSFSVVLPMFYDF